MTIPSIDAEMPPDDTPDPDLPGRGDHRGRSDCTVCAAPTRPDALSVQAERDAGRGIVWVVLAFVICPCHLPLTLWALSALLAGTVAGMLVTSHATLVAVVLSVLWAAATWHGFRLMRPRSNG